jgi:dipeptidyl-peptidase-4
MAGPTDSFPRQSARTQRFTLGAPRDVTVSRDGARVAFLRSAGPEDPVTALWVLDLGGGDERIVIDPRSLLNDVEDLPAEERARRERARESAAGLTGYATDAAHRVATAALAGRLVVADMDAGTAAVLDVPSPVIDPRPDPTGRRVAWSDGRGLWVAEIERPESAHPVASDPDPEVRWGVAEFVAAEDLDRHRGFWWAPDGEALLVARVDDTPVPRWWISDPAQPAQEPTQVAYPAAGTPNALVSAWIVQLAGTAVPVDWDAGRHEYLAAAQWDQHGPMLAVLARDQRSCEVLAADPGSGATVVAWSDSDDAWVERLRGTPRRLADGRLVVGRDGPVSRHLVVGGDDVTPDDLVVRSVCDVGDDEVLFTANPVEDATVIDVWRWSGVSGLKRLTGGDGVHSASAGGGTVVVRRTTLDDDGATFVVGGPTLRSLAAEPLIDPVVTIRHLGDRRLPVALLLPTGAAPDARLPVLLDPYGGPHAQRVVRARSAFLSSQWFADQGFAVVVIDGRGTPGRGSAWERAVRGDLAGPVLEDQLDGLAALAAEEPRLDLTRVAVRGWSFGGHLAALAVLRHPDAVHAAVAGAPVTDFRLYDTVYTERYLGHPDHEPAAYERSSAITDAAALRRPLLLVHGLADDNVVAAHTLQLSSALLAAGRPHQVLPLTGVTHMTSQEEVAENVLLLQLAFLREALGLNT